MNRLFLFCIPFILGVTGYAGTESPPILLELYQGTFKYDPSSPPDLVRRDPSSGKSLLHEAIRTGAKDLATEIIDKHPVELVHQDNLGNNAIHAIVRQRDTELFRAAHQANRQSAIEGLLAKNRAGWSPLELAAFRLNDNPEGYLEVVSGSINENAVDDLVTPALRYRQLTNAITSSNYNAMVQLLLAHPELANRTGPDGYGLICVAGAIRDIAAVHILLGYGAKPEGHANVVMSPVEWAMHFKSDETLAALRLVGRLNGESQVWANGVRGPAEETSIDTLLEKHQRQAVWKRDLLPENALIK